MYKKIDLGEGLIAVVTSVNPLDYTIKFEQSNREYKSTDFAVECLVEKIIELTEEIEGLELANIRLAAEIDALEEDI